MKLKEIAFANAGAVIGAVWYLACAILFTFAPDLSVQISQSWFHFIDLTKIGSSVVTPGSLVVGVISLAVASWLTAYFFAWVYNNFVKQ